MHQCDMICCISGLRSLLANWRCIGEAHGSSDFCPAIIDRESCVQDYSVLKQTLEELSSVPALYSGSDRPQKSLLFRAVVQALAFAAAVPALVFGSGQDVPHPHPPIRVAVELERKSIPAAGKRKRTLADASVLSLPMAQKKGGNAA